MKLIAKLAVAAVLVAAPATAQTRSGLSAQIESAIAEVTPRMIAWRRDIHEHPKLGNRETRTAALVAWHLRSLRFDEVRTGIAHTGVVGVLRGGRAGPVIAIRADMDALPVTEPVDIPFRSRVRSTYNGEEVEVMHACGHDTHVAIAMAAAEILAGRRAELAGTVIFIFQPAEEGPPADERGGAELMLEEGVFGDLTPDFVFGLHTANMEGGRVFARSGAILASSDNLNITVRGRQTHAARAQEGVDPVTVAAQIVTALQLVPTRQFDAVGSPMVISIGMIRGGVRRNIIPDEVEMQGTVRVLGAGQREEVLRRIRRTVEHIAASAGAEVDIQFYHKSPMVVNNDAATERGIRALQAALGAENVASDAPVLNADDYAYFAERTPSFFFVYGVNAPGAENAAPNHSPHFYVHEPTMQTGLRALLAVMLDRVGHGVSE